MPLSCQVPLCDSGDKDGDARDDEAEPTEGEDALVRVAPYRHARKGSRHERADD